MPRSLSIAPTLPSAPTGSAELVADAQHFHKIVREGILNASISLDIATADFKAMLVPEAGSRRAVSIVEIFRRLARKGVEIRLLHAGTPSSAEPEGADSMVGAMESDRGTPHLSAFAAIGPTDTLKPWGQTTGPAHFSKG